MRRRALAVLGAGALWGLTGVFRRSLGQLGCDSAGVIVIRCGIAAILFGVTLLLRAPGQQPVPAPQPLRAPSMRPGPCAHGLALRVWLFASTYAYAA